MFEKNGQIGGKLNVLKAEGYTFDLGPSILTLPHIFGRLFERSGKRMEDYFTDPPAAAALAQLLRGRHGRRPLSRTGPHGRRSCARSARTRPTSSASSTTRPASTTWSTRATSSRASTPRSEFRELLRAVALPQVRPASAPCTRRWRGTSRRRYMRDILDYFIKYVGSSAYRAPAFMNCLPTIQFRYDLWYVDGGLYNIARGLQPAAGRTRASRSGSTREVTEIRKDGGRVTGGHAQAARSRSPSTSSSPTWRSSRPTSGCCGEDADVPAQAATIRARLLRPGARPRPRLRVPAARPPQLLLLGRSEEALPHRLPQARAAAGPDDLPGRRLAHRSHRGARRAATA